MILFDCEKLLKYLNSRTNEEIEQDTVLAKGDTTVSNTVIGNWKHLKKGIEKARIEALNIAVFDDVEILCTKINQDSSTLNAKRVFNMLVRDYKNYSEKLKLYITDKNKDTPLVKYMTGILKVNVESMKNKSVDYLPGRSVDLSMLYECGQNLNTSYTKSGIVAGLKTLVGLKLVEAFRVIETANGYFDTKQLSKEDIIKDDSILYRLSINGCAEYIKEKN